MRCFMLGRRFGRLLQFGSVMLALGLLAAISPARAIEIRLAEPTDPTITFVELSGSIVRGDAQKVQAFLSQLPKERQIAVRLDSPGGLIDEALRIGRHLHANHIRTYVTGRSTQCLSACALAFLGGRDLSGQTFRVKGSDSPLGFHGFRRVVPDKEFTVADMHEAVATTQRVILSIADYLTSVDADIEFMSLMLEKPSTEMNYLSNEKATSIGVHVWVEATGRLVPPFGPQTRSSRRR
jgi:hypothetical protein